MKIIKNAKIVKLGPTSNLGVYTATYQNQDSGELFVGRSTIEVTPFTLNKNYKIIGNNDGSALLYDEAMPIVYVLGTFILLFISLIIYPLLGMFVIAGGALAIPIHSVIVTTKTIKQLKKAAPISRVGTIIGYHERRVRGKSGYRIYKHPVVEYEYNGERYQHVWSQADTWLSGESVGNREILISNESQDVFEHDSLRDIKRMRRQYLRFSLTMFVVMVIFFTIMITDIYEIDIWTPIFEFVFERVNE